MQLANSCRSPALPRFKARIWAISLIFLYLDQQYTFASPRPRIGYATYYTAKSCQKEGTSGTRTATNEVFNEMAQTCALPHHQFGKWYRVCVLGTSRCVVVRHNDYGPGRHAGRHGVVIDLSPAAYQQLAPLKSGRVKVSLEPLTHLL